MQLRTAWMAALAAVALTGCPSASTLGLARPLRAGSVQMAVAPEAVILGANSTASGNITLPQVEVAVRYGITDRVEFGAKAWLIGAGVETKIGLLESKTMRSGVDLSVAPSVSYFGLGAGTSDTSGNINVVTFGLPVLFGVNFAGHQLVLGPKVSDQLYMVSGATGGTMNVVSVGGSAGLAFKLGKGFRVLPEVSVLFPVAAQSSGGATGFGLGEGYLFQAGIGFLVGGEYEASAPPEAP